jgi:hypothetical protein
MKWRTWNWWKVGFFTMLIVFEMTREWAVLNADPYPAVAFADVTALPGNSHVSSEGQWRRTNAGEALEFTAVRFDCTRSNGTCVMATEPYQNPGMMPPFIDIIPATFTDTGVDMTEESSVCAIWRYRIDTVHEITLGLRTLKPTNDPVCRGLEPRIEARFTNWTPADYGAWNDRHFRPIMQLLGRLL